MCSLISPLSHRWLDLSLGLTLHWTFYGSRSRHRSRTKSQAEHLKNSLPDCNAQDHHRTRVVIQKSSWLLSVSFKHPELIFLGTWYGNCFAPNSHRQLGLNACGRQWRANRPPSPSTCGSRPGKDNIDMILILWFIVFFKHWLRCFPRLQRVKLIHQQSSFVRPFCFADFALTQNRGWHLCRQAPPGGASLGGFGGRYVTRFGASRHDWVRPWNTHYKPPMKD